MYPPVELEHGSDVFDPALTSLIENADDLLFIWLAPPCSSFSTLRNLDAGGPLRPRGNPEGDSSHPGTALGNKLWARALQLCKNAVRRGIPVVIEHPAGSRAWHLKSTIKFLAQPSVFSIRLDQCMFGSRNQKPTTLLSSAAWLRGKDRRCNRQHIHSRGLRGARAKKAAAYPLGFCDYFVTCLQDWLKHGASAQEAAAP